MLDFITRHGPAMLLHLMAFQFNHRKSLRKYLKNMDGWFNFTVGLRTEKGSAEAGIRFENGKCTVLPKVPKEADAVMFFTDEKAFFKMLRQTPNEALNMLMYGKIRTTGNFTYHSLFNFYLSRMAGPAHRAMEKIRQKKETKEKKQYGKTSGKTVKDLRKKRVPRLRAKNTDPKVKHLENPYLTDMKVEDFPRLVEFLDNHFEKRPEICPERPKILTGWFRENGFENQKDKKPWNPVLRQALALKHLMKNKKPIIGKNDLLAGTTTSKDVGVILYPDAHGALIWGELESVGHRELNPYDISEKTVEILHNQVFPYYIHRNFRELVRKKYDNPLCQQLDERFAVYFVWKSVGISHTIPDFEKLLKTGANGIINEIKKKLKTVNGDQEKAASLKAMIITLEGLNEYARNLAAKARIEENQEKDPVRKKELLKIADVCEKVPAAPAATLYEAVQAIWISWVALHMENTNTGLSLGRLDQLLQPYFEADMSKAETGKEKEKLIYRAVELIGCLYMRCADHLPLIPDIGNYLFGGSSSNQAITLGGVTSDGKDAVCDMTYIFLKVTEILGVRDPNVNARYDPQINSDTYLKRLCEVNYITRATPSLHNDQAVTASLAGFNYPDKELRNWSATGCVEPTISGKHMGHTGSILLSMVAPLEMALFEGRHPLMNWKAGPDAGNDFETFEDFFSAYQDQLTFLIDNAVEYNNMLAQAHAELRPTPLLSSLIDGCVEKGKDVTKGGAKYNSSGTALIGLADVTDSLMTIKKLVFEQGKISFAELKEALKNNFSHNPRLLTFLKNKTPKFGSGDKEAVEMADRVAALAHKQLSGHRNYRGGPYTAGFWSMSNHVAFGTLAGALPSGRLAQKAFTPGLTPLPGSSENMMDNLHDVAALSSLNMDNNMAFNVKVTPGINDDVKKLVDNISSAIKAYFLLGGMQMQLNIMSAESLRDAMINPEHYRDLLVRISGYNAYFVTLNKDMQMELIERSEYSLS